MKFHVAFDEALGLILAKDLLAFIVITYSTAQSVWRYRLEERFARSFGRDARRVRFLESVAPDRFVSLLSFADVMIDPYPWGGGVTTLEALSVGTVVITLPRKQTVRSGRPEVRQSS